jgi:histidinol-phosphate aminotransferase
MSKFFSERYKSLTPYTPGEQPKDRKFIKLNTNESPFPPSPSVLSAVSEQCGMLQLYSDPESAVLTRKMAELYGVSERSVIMTNGSDEVLNFAFMAFADEARPLIFPDITYGFYPVFAELNRIPYETIPLREDFTVCADDYMQKGKTVVIANPNAPTGIALPLSDIERIVSSNPDNVVIIDEAYVDFGAESALSLIDKYDNLLVTGTFSKSRSLAGARLGFGFGSPSLIADLHTVRYSTNPYNVNRMTMAAGLAAILDDDYYMDNAKRIMECREYTREALVKLGFRVLPSSANFLFAESDKIDGGELYGKLKARGVLVRHFTKERIKGFNRITVGTREQMDALLSAITDILKENST